mmetsp:Transcript_158340/g.507817  ORF Transcript_158340/g.507817 Transcript_158340/m.507817 type:complete len:447 (+) Transcript_158340:52-1392(+)
MRGRSGGEQGDAGGQGRARRSGPPVCSCCRRLAWCMLGLTSLAAISLSSLQGLVLKHLSTAHPDEDSGVAAVSRQALKPAQDVGADLLLEGLPSEQQKTASQVSPPSSGVFATTDRTRSAEARAGTPDLQSAREVLDPKIQVPQASASGDREAFSSDRAKRASELRGFEVQYANGEDCGVTRCDTVIILSRSREDIEWIKPLAGDHSFVIHGQPLTLPFLRQNPTPINTYVPGREEAKYLAYLIMEYDMLPERMVFLHAHDIKQSQHERFIFGKTSVTKAAVVEHLVSTLSRSGGTGAPSGFLSYPGDCRIVFSAEYSMQSLWKQFNLSRSLGQLPKAWESVCCAQFIVSKKAVLANPRHLYENLYDWILDRQTRAKREKRLADGTMAMEHSWRLLFENVTARSRSPCEDLEAPFASKRVAFPNKPGLKQLAKKLRFRSNGVAFDT